MHYGSVSRRNKTGLGLNSAWQKMPLLSVYRRLMVRPRAQHTAYFNIADRLQAQHFLYTLLCNRCSRRMSSDPIRWSHCLIVSPSKRGIQTVFCFFGLNFQCIFTVPSTQDPLYVCTLYRGISCGLSLSFEVRNLEQDNIFELLEILYLINEKINMRCKLT